MRSHSKCLNVCWCLITVSICTLQAANNVEYVLQTSSLVEMHAWLSAVQQCLTAETVSSDAADSQSTEPLVLFL